jgi:hypothetical protein
VIRSLAVVGLLAAVVAEPRVVFAAEPLPPAPLPPAPLPPAPLPPPEGTTPPSPAPADAPPPLETPPPVAESDVAPPPPPGAVIAPNAEPAAKVPVESPPRPYESRHGLFFQAALGGGALFGSNNVAADTRSFSGVAISWNLLLGGTMQRRWAAGAGISREHVPAPKSHDDVIDGDEPDLDAVSLSLESLLVFADYHPYADGFHALGQLGFGYLIADRESGRQSARDANWVVSLGAGYDFKLPGALSVGGLAQLTYTRQEMWETERRVDLDLLFPSLLVTAAYR